jgi:hypothetical protein
MQAISKDPYLWNKTLPTYGWDSNIEEKHIIFKQQLLYFLDSIQDNIVHQAGRIGKVTK